MSELKIPYIYEVKGDKNGSVVGGFAFLYLCYRLIYFYCNMNILNNINNLFCRYPGILLDQTKIWGREYSQLSKIFNTCLDDLFLRHEGKFIGNIGWYQDHFDMYNTIISQKVSLSPLVPNQNRIPANLENLFAFLDGTVKEISRPDGVPGIQNAFWNRYYY